MLSAGSDKPGLFPITLTGRKELDMFTKPVMFFHNFVVLDIGRVNRVLGNVLGLMDFQACVASGVFQCNLVTN